MLLLEHDAKTLLAAAGIPVPAGILADRADAPIPLTGPLIVKAQIPVGGRGKAGGTRTAATHDEANAHLAALLGTTIKNHPVRECRIEQQVNGAEAYLSLAVDPASAGIRVLASTMGGVEIETLHRASVQSTLANPDRNGVVTASTTLALPPIMRDAITRLADAFFRYEATLLEINPLFLTHTGWIAGDAKMILDADAAPRVPAIAELIRNRAAAYPEAYLKLTEGFDFAIIDQAGRVGMVTTGAGLSMMLIDELTARGLAPFNFCDIRTGQLRGDPRRLIDVLRRIANGPGVRVVLVSVFAGITDLGEFATLLVAAMRAVPELQAPVIARIIGNGFERACHIIAQADLPITVEPDLDRALAAVARHA